MNDDLISRQAAIDILDAFEVKIEDGEPFAYSWARMRIKELPSAQPEKVKCKKCRYVYYDKEFDNYWCNRMSDSFKVEEDGYCKWGK